MSLYNVKTIEYLNSTQVRIYARPVKSDNKIQYSSPDVWAGKQKKQVSTQKRTQSQINHSVETSVNRTINAIYSIARSNKWDYFVTLTIDPKKLNNADYKLITYKLSVWINNLKKRYAPELKYIFVPELHKDRLKWHFHGLFANMGCIPLEFSGKTCVGKYVFDYVKKPFATKIYNLPSWKYGFSTATIIRDSNKSASYITKYVTKDMNRILANRHRYFSSNNCDIPCERVYNIDYEQIEQIILERASMINYMSNVKVSKASQEITYLEVEK